MLAVDDIKAPEFSELGRSTASIRSIVLTFLIPRIACYTPTQRHWLELSMNNKKILSKYSLIQQGTSRAIVCEGVIRLGLVDRMKLDKYVRDNGRKLPADDDIQWALKHALVSRYRVFGKTMSAREMENTAALDN
jgi:hypothetical protein